ncbi:hypothetical protein GQ44DRAFT_224986 [Phaeosphaeriaceae sp. PMI808]|nr:hypothetical protein GQ44DRAFT_224986 [Phaeosphaeriaceae sp. PMI808]
MSTHQNAVKYAKEDAPESAPTPVQSKAHSSFLKGIIGKAREWGQDTTPKCENKSKRPNFTAAELADVEHILAQLEKNRSRNAEEDRKRQGRNSTRISAWPTDINRKSNRSGNAVHCQVHKTTNTTVAGVPYPVSTETHPCTRCTLHRRCERHREREWQKTDISLCSGNHVRMILTWDISDPENRNGSWRFDIQPKYDRFYNPERERRDHEQSIEAQRKAQDEDRKLGEQERGCCPLEPKWRVKELTKRIIEDYNSDQKDKAKKEYIDSKVREYATQPHHWGKRNPFVPHECISLNGSKVERELRVLLQAWHRSQLGPNLIRYDSTTAKMNDTWAKKMEKARLKKQQAEQQYQHQTTTQAKNRANKAYDDQDERRFGKMDNAKEIEASSKQMRWKQKKVARELASEKRKFLKQIAKAEDKDAKAEEVGPTAEPKKQKTTPDPVFKGEIEASEEQKSTHKAFSPLPSPELTQNQQLGPKSPQTNVTPLQTSTQKVTKRKAASASEADQPPTKKSRETGKPANFVSDSDGEAGYQLPSAQDTTVAQEIVEKKEAPGTDQGETNGHEVIDPVTPIAEVEPTLPASPLPVPWTPTSAHSSFSEGSVGSRKRSMSLFGDDFSEEEEESVPHKKAKIVK